MGTSRLEQKAKIVAFDRKTLLCTVVTEGGDRVTYKVPGVDISKDIGMAVQIAGERINGKFQVSRLWYNGYDFGG